MNRHSMLTMIATAVAWLWIALPPGNAAAQTGSGHGRGESSEQGLLRGAVGDRQWRGNGKGVGSYALRHIRRPALQIDHCRLGGPKEVLGRDK